MRPLTACFLFGAVLLAGMTARAQDLVVVVDTATEMPMARFENFKLVDGVHRDIGAELARRLGRRPVYLSLPRKRLARALEQGQGDVLCAYMPEWLGGAFDWSTPFIPVAEVLITDIRAPAPHAIEDVADQPVGSVLGFQHPEMTETLGEHFVRDDAPSTEANLRKLAAGRIRHALIGRSMIAWRLKHGDPPLHLHPPLHVKSYLTQCAVSRNGHVRVADVNRAIAAMLKDGVVDTILARYE
jgi:polar amino acid transport system substrate-binding protein